jgi:hypothetical protein
VTPELPKDILASDLERVKAPQSVYKTNRAYKAFFGKPEHKIVAEFEMWYCNGMGWVIPTLLIRTTRRMDRANRTYATSLNGHQCRVGMGPHVLRQVTVYVRATRQSALQKYLDLKLKGEQDSNQIRDRISTRRAMGTMRRSIYGF